MRSFWLVLAALYALTGTTVAYGKPAGLQWNAYTIFMGQRVDPEGNKVLYWLAAIESTTPDASGYTERWFSDKPFYQPSYADHDDLNKRDLCNASGSNACVQADHHYHEQLFSIITVK
jgi:hypothetical protein